MATTAQSASEATSEKSATLGLPVRRQALSSGRVYSSVQEDEVDGVKKPLRALGPVTDTAGRTKFRNPIVCLVFTHVENYHIPATSACASCLISRARTCFCPYDATATVVSRRKSFKRDPDLDESVERGRTDSSIEPYSVSRRHLRPVVRRCRASCRTTHKGA
jgi:hypothetical protein